MSWQSRPAGGGLESFCDVDVGVGNGILLGGRAGSWSCSPVISISDVIDYLRLCGLPALA